MSPDRPDQKKKSKLTREAAQAINKLRTDRGFWDALTDELYPVACANISRRTWPGGYKPLPDAIVADAISAITHGDWSWDPNDGLQGDIHELYPAWTPEMCSFHHKCCNFIRSRVSEEYRKSKRFQSGDGVATSIGEEFPGESDVYKTTEFFTDTPLETLISEENWNELVRLLPKAVNQEDQLLHRLVEEIAFSYPEREPAKAGNRPRKPGWANRELAAKLSVPESAIVNTKRHLDRILEQWLWARFLEALPHDGRPWLALVNTAGIAALAKDWKQSFAAKHGLSLREVVEMGAELLQLLYGWRERTIRDASALQKKADRIQQNILMNE